MREMPDGFYKLLFANISTLPADSTHPTWFRHGSSFLDLPSNRMLSHTRCSDNTESLPFFGSFLHHGVFLFLVSFLLTLQLAVRWCSRDPVINLIHRG